jgi:AAA domain
MARGGGMTPEFPPPDARLAGKVRVVQLGNGDCRATEKDGPSWSRNAFTAAQLQQMNFPPISWIVPDIIPAEGVTLLCSKPKFGKSWLAYDLCIACTSDRFILGNIKPAQGDVLYLALEDSKRRLQRRMDKLLPTFGAKWPSRLTIKTEWKRLHEGGLNDIRAWHADTREGGGNPIAVAIDVLAMVRKPVGNRQLYEADYEALVGLTKLANELSVAIVVLHHTRKMASDDLMETVSGSFGVSGAVDTILVMANKAVGSVLDIRGRDVESRELAIEFQKEPCRWRILGAAAEVHVSEQRGKIIGVLRGAPDGMSVPEIMAATGSRSRGALDTLLFKMREAGEIHRKKRGTYLIGEDTDKIGKKERNDGQPLIISSEYGNLTNLTNLTGAADSKINTPANADTGAAEGTGTASEGLQACTDRKAKNGAANEIDRESGLLGATLAPVAADLWQDLDIPSFLRRPSEDHPPCAQCNLDDGKQESYQRDPEGGR